MPWLDWMRAHPAFRDSDLIGSDGFSPPCLNAAEVIEVSEATLPRLAALGLRVTGSFGAGNRLVLDPAMPPVEVTLQFHGTAGNVVLLDPHCRLRGALSFESADNVAVVGAACPQRDQHVSAWFRYGGAGMFLGAGGSAGQINCWVEGPERAVVIGDDLLASWGIWLRTADSHGLIDLDSGALINPSRSIVLGPHVWLGQDVMVMAGVTIGGGSVVGARSVVTQDVPAASVVAGVPARVVRTKTSWTRNAHPGHQEVAALQTRGFAAG